MTVGILTEKNSAGRNFAKALGGQKGNYNGEDYVIVSAAGHVYESKQPHDMVPDDKAQVYKKWSLSGLPWDYKEMDFGLQPSAPDVVARLKSGLAGVDEIVIATDVDPSGEGELLAWEIIDGLDLHYKKISRMYFSDEAAPSIQKAFVERKPISSMNDDGDYRKALYRQRFDLLSMQSTRMASILAGEAGKRVVLRNGRLKSAMVVLVGDQLKAHNEYVKTSTFEVRFTDDHDVVYSNPEAQRYNTADEVPVGDYHVSDVEHVSSTNKKTAPPKLLDLSGLSTILAKRGIKPAEVMSVYQKLYEAQIVSYPRTEDKFVSLEQFNELLPKIDAIAGLVGINTSALTHRSPRKTHVKEGGAHGANRPGPNVPNSLDDLAEKFGATAKAIYEVLAKNYLTMFGEDYTYIQHKGRVKDYPDFVGSITEPVEMGWKAIFDSDAERDDSDDKADDNKHTSLGSTATPDVAEIIPPRPPAPTMNWLMKQLEKRNVGTGATRTSTFADVTAAESKKNKYPLMAESKGKISFKPAGEINYYLLPGTTIGDLELTKQVADNMDKIAAGELEIDTALASVAEWVVKDIDIMRSNMSSMPESAGSGLASVTVFKEKEKYTGLWAKENTEKTFNRSWSSHRFSDEECEKLLAGETVDVTMMLGKSSDEKLIHFTLEYQDLPDGSGKFFGPKGVIDDSLTHVHGVWAKTGKEIRFKKRWGDHTFTEAEIADLLAGKEIEFPAVSAKGNNYVAKGALAEKSYQGHAYVGFDPKFDKSKHSEKDPAVYATGIWAKTNSKVSFKKIYSGHTFTEEEISKLLAGKTIEFPAKAKNGNEYVAKGSLDNLEYNGTKYVGFKRIFDKK